VTLTSAPVVRTTPPPAQPVSDEQRTRNWWPSFCVPCGITDAWFPTRVERLRFELQHDHGGAD
jgi:hypothetical protein